MKKSLLRIVAIFVAVAFIVGIGYAVVPKYASAKSSKKQIKIGLSLATLQEERWHKDRDEFVKAAQKLGAKVLVQAANMDDVKQKEQCENLISQGVDVLVIVPNNAEVFTSIIEEAHKAKIPVISYDRLIKNANVDLYISFDNIKVGELQGKYLTSKVPKGNYFVFRGAPTDNNATLFYQGAMKYIQPLVKSGKVKVLFDQPVKDWKPEEALRLCENALTAAKNNVQGILAPNDGTAGGIIQALKAQGLAGKVVVTGQDADLAAVKRIVEGTQTMTVFKDVRLLAKKAAEVAVELAKGKKVSQLKDVNGKVYNGKLNVPSILLTPVAVDKSNIDKVLIQSGWFTKEQVYGKK
ncbi:D-xylose ABC transporter, periplasmic substrate-binding protein [Caldicellulosiruptor kronotskyensis 2002]|uniref:D-xylose ABC transporter, periplasmic substrate-binding protein n=1 Tax=Caldicellulosiruptor kronotskyensis (strain DSM 18902 / VKM B-2412 / 2002) TaxID=632348 RepID=E4SCR1_CALK2|nr:D-xylose ABC transporter substrate-binding protein [Caldicellulosiruptor kronotskyensis]ADQ45044.1 D-xylose ABC transporter, periplasmic substrate-binding protein [Caldicellulosiruptor kronotskyensis 2002]